MARNNALFSKVDQALNSSNVHIQAGAISSLMQSVSRYVEQIHADEEIIGQIRNYERTVKNLRGEKTPEAEEELKEVHELLEKAKNVERNMERKKKAINDLKSEVESLHRALSRI